MQGPIGPITTAITVQTIQLRARTSAPLRIDDALDAKKRQAEQRQAETNSTPPEQITLHDLIPPELLNLPQAVTGKSAALASYLANQSLEIADHAPADDSFSSSPGNDASNSVNAHTDFEQDSGRDGKLPTTVSPARGGLLPTGLNKATVAASYRLNNAEQVYVAVPDKIIAASPQTSKLKTLTQNISDNVRNAYYRFMTMVPYSVGMLINVFA